MFFSDLRALGIALILGLTACRTAGVPPEQARAFAARLQSVALADPPERLQLLALACADLPSCAQACGAELRGYGSARWRERLAPLATCEAYTRYARTFSGQNTSEGQVGDEWVHVQLRRFAGAAAGRARGTERLQAQVDQLVAGEKVYFEP